MQTPTNEKPLLTDIAPIIRAIWKYKWLIMLILAVAATIGYLRHRQEKAQYVATADIRIGRVWNEPVEDASVLVTLINGQPFLARLADELDLKRNPENLNRVVNAEKLEAGKGRARYVFLVRITTRAGNAEKAQQLANAAAEQTIEYCDKRFTEALTIYQTREKELQEKIDKIYQELAGNKTPAEVLAKRLEVNALEQQLAEIKLNTTAPLKTYRTELADEIGPAKLQPGKGLIRDLAIPAATGLAISLLAILAIEFGWPIFKAKEKGD